MLKNKGANDYFENNDNNTLLMNVCLFGKKDIVEFLL
jgi:hypothetical protein